MSGLESLLNSVSSKTPVPFSAEFPDGRSVLVGRGEPAFRLKIVRRRALRRVAMFGHIGLLDAYFDGDVDIEGDFSAIFRVGMEIGFDRPGLMVRLRNRWHEFRLSNRSFAQAKANARFHYGLGYDFYRQWLDDPLMMYTCAYWGDGVTNLEEAQRAKVEHVCRKVRLQPGERVIDIGCGFGGFMFHAAERHGVQVVGTNTTTEQVEELQGRIAAGGWGDRLKVVEADFREVFDQFDKVVSIGTLEHAGRDQLFEVVSAHARFLKPGGLGMLHFIGHVGQFETEFFIRQHVFPGGWIPSLAETIDAMEKCGLEVVDIENLRRHYALTLDEWSRRFEARWETIRAIDPKRFDERFRRIWRTYLTACAEMFRSPVGHTHLFQITFSKGNITRANYPMSRKWLYDQAVAEPATARPRPHREPVPSRRLD